MTDEEKRFDRREEARLDAMYDAQFKTEEENKREWQGLTDEEIHSTNGYEEDRKLYRFAHAIEAKLKEKNT